MTRLYNAALFTNAFDKLGRTYARLTPAEQRWRDTCEYFLESYHYINNESYVRRIRNEGVKVFLDSGAFSAFTKGEVIDLPRYCDYIHRNADIIDFPSVLDSIGDYKGTYRNQMEMERRGVRPLPCYHYGEPEEVLEHYIANYEYITIGGMVPISTPQLKIWLDRIWGQYLTNTDGSPKIKVHGFGLTSPLLMLRYPWFSVDSSSWVQTAANGSVFLPRKGRPIAVSVNSPARKMAGMHLDSVTPLEREALVKELERYNADIERVQTLYYTRWAFNAMAFPQYLKYYEHLKTTNYIEKDPGLF